jgi:hypothetical protein
MKLAIINSDGSNKSVWEHTVGNELNQVGGCEGMFLDSPMVDDRSVDLPVVNSCVGIQNILLNDELRSDLYQSMGIIPGASTASLYALFNGTKFSEFIEIAYSGRFMTGDIGPDIIFSHGAGIKCKSHIHEAFPALIKLREMLTKLQYHGEVFCTISKDFIITDVRFGHNVWAFGMFSEICKSSVQDMLGFMFEQVEVCELHESICVANLITSAPFPSRSLTPKKIHAPKGAEKHLWRIPYGGSENVLAICHGSYLKEARKRIRRTIDNLLSFDNELQYRLDYGLRMEFVLNSDEYKKFEETNYSLPVSDPSPVCVP